MGLFFLFFFPFGNDTASEYGHIYFEKKNTTHWRDKIHTHSKSHRTPWRWIWHGTNKTMTTAAEVLGRVKYTKSKREREHNLCIPFLFRILSFSADPALFFSYFYNVIGVWKQLRISPHCVTEWFPDRYIIKSILIYRYVLGSHK
jgi:hypothetical protein